MHGSHGTNVALSPRHSPVFIPAPTEKCFTVFMMDFHMGGVSAAVFLSQGHSPVFMPAPAEKGFTGFMMDFLMGGVSAAVLKTADAPLERIKILIQSQDEMLKFGRLSEPYQGITDCFGRIIKEERVISLWRGNTANVICYFHTL